MADTDSDSEIQFKVVNEVTEDGHGDVNPMLDQDDATDEEPQHETPIPEDVHLPDAQLPHGHRVRSQSRERLDQLYPRQSPDRGRRVPDRNLLDAGDYARYPAPRPRRRESPKAHSPYLYEGPAPRPVRQQHRLQVKPEFFNGEDDWDQYISHFQNCADLGRWSETDKALALSACLKGQARAFYLGLSPLDRSSYHRLVQKFSERFGSVRQQSRYLTKFETRNRGQGETIASLGDDLRLLAQRAYPELGTDAQESLALHQFYKAISLEMKCRCIDRDCRTVESAVQVVERYEAILGEGTEKKKGNVRAINNMPSNPQPYHNRSNNGPKSNDRAQPSATTEAILKQVLDRLEKLEGVTTSTATKESYQPKPYYRRSACFVCQSPEHFLKDCPIYQKCQAEMQATNGQVLGNENPSAL